MNYQDNKSSKKKGVREAENIVPPLSLKNISMKNPQNKATGKKTQTTMQSTQIRDKILGSQPQKSMVENSSTPFSNEQRKADKIEEQKQESISSRSSSSSGYDYPLGEMIVEPPKPKVPSAIPKLDFGSKIAEAKPEVPKLAPLPVKIPPLALPPKTQSVGPKPVPKLGNIPKFGLDLEKLRDKEKDFQDEFMSKFDEYSKSWRDLIEQEKRF